MEAPIVMPPRFALSIPHTPWVEERVASLSRLLTMLDIEKGPPFILSYGSANHHPRGGYKLFNEKAPNWQWSKEMWTWAANQGAQYAATHFVQLQDDVIVAPNFWNALTAMVTAVPDKIIGLQGAHPKFRQLARDDFRWAVSRTWMVGVGYVLPMRAVTELSERRALLPDELAKTTNEDDMVGHYALNSNYGEVWHPLPTIIDHDTSVASTYGNDTHNFRRPTVTWREFTEKSIESVDFWTPKCDPPLVTNPHLERCWMCEKQHAQGVANASKARICWPCARAFDKAYADSAARKASPQPTQNPDWGLPK